MQCSRDLFGYERHKSLDLSSIHIWKIMAIGNQNTIPISTFTNPLMPEHFDKFTSQNLCLYKIDKII